MWFCCFFHHFLSKTCNHTFEQSYLAKQEQHRHHPKVTSNKSVIQYFVYHISNRQNRSLWFSLNINLASWQKNTWFRQQLISIYTPWQDFFLGKSTEVMLNKTCGSLKAFNSGLEFETIVSAAVDQGNTDFYHGFVGSVFFSLHGNITYKRRQAPPLQDLWSYRVRLHFHLWHGYVDHPQSKALAHCHSVVSIKTVHCVTEQCVVHGTLHHEP